MANTKAIRLLRDSLTLSPLQRTVLIGTLLGDGCLMPAYAGNARLQITHCEAQKELVFWKYDVFKDWALQPPFPRPETQSWRFRTISHPELAEFRQTFYRGNTKIVPDNITSLLTEPLSLAVWLMDDGGKKDNSVSFSTYGFFREGNLLLQECLKANFGLETSIQHDSKGYRLYVLVKSAKRLEGLVREHVLPCLTYKLSLTP
jgi:hypothetical protein